jgi:hypothetical protein
MSLTCVSCLSFLWADSGVLEASPKHTVVSFVLRNTYAQNNGSSLNIHITEGDGSPSVKDTALEGLPVCWSLLEPSFGIKWIGASNSIIDAITTVSVTLQPNADLLPGEQVLIKDTRDMTEAS